MSSGAWPANDYNTLPNAGVGVPIEENRWKPSEKNNALVLIYLFNHLARARDGAVADNQICFEFIRVLLPLPPHSLPAASGCSAISRLGKIICRISDPSRP